MFHLLNRITERWKDWRHNRQLNRIAQSLYPNNAYPCWQSNCSHIFKAYYLFPFLHCSRKNDLMNWVDLALLLVVLLAIWSGWRSGFICGTLDLANWIGSVLLGFLFILTWVSSCKWFSRVGILAAAIGIDHHHNFSKASYRGDNWCRIAWVAGRLMIARWIIWEFFRVALAGQSGLQLISALLLALPLWNGITTQTRNSQIATEASTGVEWVNEKFSPVFDKAVQQTINNLTIHPASNESVKLPFKDDHPEVRADLELTMLELVNQERVQGDCLH